MQELSNLDNEITEVDNMRGEIETLAQLSKEDEWIGILMTQRIVDETAIAIFGKFTELVREAIQEREDH